MTIPTRLRQREIITAQLASCQGVDSSFSRGAVAALRWLTSGGPGPLTCAAAAPIDFGGIVHELAAAEAIIYGPPSTGREYARGVEHALLWAEFATSAPPIPAEDRGRGGSNERPSKSGSLDDGRVLAPRQAPRLAPARSPGRRRTRAGGAITDGRWKVEEDACLREL